MTTESPFLATIHRGLRLHFIRCYWEADTSSHWEAEAMRHGYQGA